MTHKQIIKQALMEFGLKETTERAQRFCLLCMERAVKEYKLNKELKPESNVMTKQEFYRGKW